MVEVCAHKKHPVYYNLLKILVMSKKIPRL